MSYSLHEKIYIKPYLTCRTYQKIEYTCHIPGMNIYNVQYTCPLAYMEMLNLHDI